MTGASAERSADSPTSAFRPQFQLHGPTQELIKQRVVAGPSCGLLSCPADLDLFGRRAAKPTTTVHDCSAETGSSTETCTINAPAGDWYYVGVYTYSGSANQSFTVKATIT